MAAIVSEKMGMKATGTRCTVPDHDVCRLSYYLKCGTVGCGLDIIVDELLDFKNAHKLPRARQDAIFKLAYDDILAIHENILIGGEQKQVRKIMVCNKTWLEKFYINPLLNNRERLQSGADMTSLGGLLAVACAALIANNCDGESQDHCSHCKGGSGQCVCQRGCPVKSSTQCSAARKHCSHCKGLDGICSCKEGCPPKPDSMCHVVHSRIYCDGCNMSSIEGPRYKCNSCSSYDLCEKCYNQGKHKAHPFERYERVGSTSTFLLAQEEPVSHKHCSHCDGANGKCKCTQGCLAKKESKCIVVHDVRCRGTNCNIFGIRGPCYKCSECWEVYFCQKCYDAGEHVLTSCRMHSFLRLARVGSRPVSMDPQPPPEPTEHKASRPQADQHIPVATPVTPIHVTKSTGKEGPQPVNVTPIRVEAIASFEKGMAVTLINMTSNPEMNGTSAVVVMDLGEKVVVDVESLSKKITVKPENLQLDSALANGTLVEFKNLSKAEMNGKLAVVTDNQVNSKGRVKVKLLEQDLELLIKLENLEIIEDM